MSRFFDDLSNLDKLAVGLNAELGDPWHGNGAFDGAVPLDRAVKILTVNSAKDALYRQIHLVDDDGNAVFDDDGLPVFTYVPVHADGKLKYGIFDNDDDYCFQSDVSEGFKIHDYVELLDWLAAIVDAGAGDVEIGCAMALNHKEQAMVQIRPPEGVTVGGDKILPWLAAHSSLNSSWATGIKACRTRLACDNTGRMIMSEGNPVYKIKHTTNSGLRLAEARELIGVMFDKTDEMAAEIDRFQNITVTDNQFAQVVDKLVPMIDLETRQPLDGRSKTIAESKRDTLARLWIQDPRVKDYRGTAWGAIQTMNTAVTHEFTVRGAASGVTRTDRQAINTVSGAIDKVDETTIEAINAVFADMRIDVTV